MTRINCHSAFKHYEMFHSRGCCGDSFGSVFNTTYNINTNGWGGGNFWSGFGLGLGNAFGGMFSGLFGGGMNMFGGNMFGGGMFGNYGMPWGGGFGNYGLYGGGSYPSSRTSASDPDCKVIADISGKVKDLPDDATKEKIDALIKDIDNAIDKLDANNYVDQKRTLENLKAELQKKSPKTTEKTDKETPTTTTTGPEIKKKEDPEKKTVTDDKVTAAIDAGDKDNIKKLLKNPNLTEAQKTMLNNALEYETGYSNVKESELDSLKDNFDLQDVIDTSDVDDFTFNKIGSRSLTKPGDKWQITIKLKSGATVKYDLKGTIAGELVFECSNYIGGQQYILQKDKNSKLHLMQYKHNPGYKVGCVSVTKRKAS